MLRERLHTTLNKIEGKTRNKNLFPPLPMILPAHSGMNRIGQYIRHVFHLFLFINIVEYYPIYLRDMPYRRIQDDKTSRFFAESLFKNSYVVIIVVADMDIEAHLGPKPL